ncbi:MAG TPA: ABC transporter, partial [Clostridiales bacterium]|nr:ABC transporter [Clostridiales bacterium]
MRGDGRMAKNPKQTISRLLSYMTQYKGTLAVVGVSVVFSAVAQAASSASLGTLVDDYITPMLSQSVPDFGPLLRFLGMMACVYLVGLVCAFFCSYLMAKVSQGTQRSIRDQLFTHMQTLPIRYFDTHPAGDIMSRYTSDIDT